MTDLGKKNILGILVTAIDYEASVEQIMAAAAARRPFSATALAVHGVMTGVMDREQRYRLNHLDLIVPDGQPVRWALKWLHKVSLPDRVYGPTLMLKLCERAAQEGLPIYLYGSSAPIVNTLARNLKAKFPALSIAGARPSGFSQLSMERNKEIVDAIRASGSAITFVGLGCPRQEVWAFENREDLSMPVVAVGAAFDFHAGMRPQAPPLLQRAGLEWLFRLLHEPRRLWKRYLLLNPYYVWLLMLQMAGLRAFDPDDGIQPLAALRYG